MQMELTTDQLKALTPANLLTAITEQSAELILAASKIKRQGLVVTSPTSVSDNGANLTDQYKVLRKLMIKWYEHQGTAYGMEVNSDDD